MLHINSLNSTANSFSFDLRTSSGDEISLSFYDDKKLEFDAKEGRGVRKYQMSLRHEVGYSFSYKGDGISQEDQKEIEEALKRIRPMYQKFLENIKKSDEFPGFQEITNITQKMKNELPMPKDSNHLEYMKDKTLDKIDEVLGIFERNDILMKATREAFDKLFSSINRFDYYA